VALAAPARPEALLRADPHDRELVRRQGHSGNDARRDPVLRRPCPQGLGRPPHGPGGSARGDRQLLAGRDRRRASLRSGAPSPRGGPPRPRRDAHGSRLVPGAAGALHRRALAARPGVRAPSRGRDGARGRGLALDPRHGCAAPRRGQDRDPRPGSAEAGPAQRRGVARDAEAPRPGSSPHRKHRLSGARPRAGAGPPREVRRDRLSKGAGGRGHPAWCPHLRRRRRLRRADHGAALSGGLGSHRGRAPDCGRAPRVRWRPPQGPVEWHNRRPPRPGAAA